PALDATDDPSDSATADLIEDAPAPGIDTADVNVDVGAGTPDASAPDLPVEVGPAPPPGELIDFLTAPGVFTAPFELRHVAAGDDVLVRFTVDGSLPTEQSRTWPRAQPLPISNTTLVRVLVTRGAERQTRAALYLQVTPALATGFASNLPLVFLHAFAATEPLPSNRMNTSGGIVINAVESGISRPLTSAGLANRMGFRVRGRSSRVWDQRSYAVELWDDDADTDRALSVVGMPPESDWVLYGPWTVDRTLLRNAFLYALSNRMGKYAPRTRFVEVFMQSAQRAIAPADYRGVYVLTEKIKRDVQRVNIANLRPTDLTAPAITGGYLFKIDDNLSPGEMALAAAGHMMELESPNWDEITPAPRTYLTDYLTDFAAAAGAADGRNPRTGLHYSDYIDVDSFIDFHIFNVFVKNPDAFRLSAYYHKDRGGKLKAGPLWDLDRTTGANDERVTSPEGWSAPMGTNVFTFGWWGGLFKDPAFEARYWARFEALLASDLRSDVFATLIGPMATELASAQQRHFDRWPSVRPTYGYLPEILQLTRWLDARIAWIKANLGKR
ncbi:MAG TPA: CotH kinase family protein, partial [Polyangia bacterium]